MSAPQRSLPAQPSLEQQRKLAKDLLRAYRAADPNATARIRQHLPDKRDIGLADAQFTLAREYGFMDWAALAAHVAASEAFTGGDLHETFRRAFAAGDLSELRALFQRHPVARRMIDAPLFPFEAPALVHFAGQGNVQMVELLLELGADPNRRSEWWAGGFHTLHVAKGEVAARLLAAGALPDACGAAHLDRPDLLAPMIEDDPSCVHQRGGDGQTPLHFARSREVVDLLLAHGADIDALDVDHRASPAQWMLERRRDAGRFPLAAYLVQRGARADVFLAAALGRADLLRAMLEADPTLLAARTGQGEFAEQPPSSLHIYTWTIGQNLSPLQVAAQFDQEEAFQVLQEFATPRQRFLAACVRGNAAEAHALLREHPHVMDELTPADQRALPDAAWAGQARPVELMLELGFDPAARGQDGGTLLHCAAWEGALECVQVALRHPGVRALLEVRDPTHGGTPLGWCCHGSRYCARPGGDYPGVARLLLEAGAEPGPNRTDATEEVLAVLRAARG